MFARNHAASLPKYCFARTSREGIPLTCEAPTCACAEAVTMRHALTMSITSGSRLHLEFLLMRGMSHRPGQRVAIYATIGWLNNLRRSRVPNVTAFRRVCQQRIRGAEVEAEGEVYESVGVPSEASSPVTRNHRCLRNAAGRFRKHVGGADRVIAGSASID